MEKFKIVTIERLSSFLKWLNTVFLKKEDYIIDDQLSLNSINPIQNIVVSNEFEVVKKDIKEADTAIERLCTSVAYLDMIDNEDIDIVAPDTAGAAIIDVVELPTEDINEDVFYRLLTACFVVNQLERNQDTVYCVTSLPDVGEAA